jgi:serine/threonine protein phosphatase PrpC
LNIGSLAGNYSPSTVIIIIAAVLLLLIAVIAKAKKSKNGGKSVTHEPLEFETVTLQNIGKREYQQDSFYVSDSGGKEAAYGKGLLAVVADGMGGLQNGKSISEITVDAFSSLFSDSSFDDPVEFLTDCVRRAENEADNYIQSQSAKGGSTVIAVLINNGGLYFASVGDSSLFMIRNGKVTLLNHYQNFASVLDSQVRQGLISREDADRHPMRSRITSFIGMGDTPEIDTSKKPVILKRDDVLMLCSDGVTNALGDNAISETIGAGSFEEAGKRIENRILEQNIGNQDNFTAILIKCKNNKD